MLDQIFSKALRIYADAVVRKEIISNDETKNQVQMNNEIVDPIQTFINEIGDNISEKSTQVLRNDYMLEFGRNISQRAFNKIVCEKMEFKVSNRTTRHGVTGQ